MKEGGKRLLVIPPGMDSAQMRWQKDSFLFLPFICSVEGSQTCLAILFSVAGCPPSGACVRARARLESGLFMSEVYESHPALRRGFVFL